MSNWNTARALRRDLDNVVAEIAERTQRRIAPPLMSASDHEFWADWVGRFVASKGRVFMPEFAVGDPVRIRGRARKHGHVVSAVSLCPCPDVLDYVYSVRDRFSYELSRSYVAKQLEPDGARRGDS